MLDLDLSKKRVLVTGGAGFLGSYIVEELRSKGCTWIIVPRSRDYDLVNQLQTHRLFVEFSPQIVIHAAAEVGGIGANQKRPGRFFYANAAMGLNVLECSRHYKVEKVVMIGTVCSYPKFAPIPFSETGLWDGYPEETNAPYGIAKKALLTMSQAYRQQYGMNIIYLIPVNLYGPRDNFDPNSSHVIPALIRKFLEAKETGAHEVIVWGSGDASREFLYVKDAAEGIVAATQKYDSAEPVNLGTGFEISIRELVFRIAEMMDYDGEIVWDGDKPNGQPQRSLDTNRALVEFGFAAKTPFISGLRDTINFWKDKVGRSSETLTGVGRPDLNVV